MPHVCSELEVLPLSLEKSFEWAIDMYDDCGFRELSLKVGLKDSVKSRMLQGSVVSLQATQGSKVSVVVEDYKRKTWKRFELDMQNYSCELNYEWPWLGEICAMSLGFFKSN